jgi:hypothetical protein
MATSEKHDRPDSDPFLARLDAWIEKIQNFRAAYLDLRASTFAPGELDPALLSAGVGAVNTSLRTPGAPADLPVGIFRDKSIPEAIRIYLAAMRRKQTVRDIAVGLKQGGLVSNSKMFETTVTGSLHRMRDAGIVLRFADGWDLAESYPDHIRKSATEPKVKATRRPSKRRKPARAKATKTRSPVRTKPATIAAKAKAVVITLDDRIAYFLRLHASQEFTRVQIGEGIGVTSPVALSLALARLIRYGKADRTTDGRYRAKQAEAEHLKAV